MLASPWTQFRDVLLDVTLVRKPSFAPFRGYHFRSPTPSPCAAIADVVLDDVHSFLDPSRGRSARSHMRSKALIKGFRTSYFTCHGSPPFFQNSPFFVGTPISIHLCCSCLVCLASAVTTVTPALLPHSWYPLEALLSVVSAFPQPLCLVMPPSHHPNTYCYGHHLPLKNVTHTRLSLPKPQVRPGCG
jgi:hypothetical protein